MNTDNQTTTTPRCACGKPSEISTDTETGFVEQCRACYEQPNRRVTEQAPPIRNDLPAVWDLVIADMQARDAEGRRKYLVPLQPMNGRNALIDAYQEILDLAAYVRQTMEELRMLGDDIRTIQAVAHKNGDAVMILVMEKLLKKYALLS